MIALIGYGNGLLGVNGGLTTDPNCCCDIPPEPCPPCCVRIDWGSFAFDSDGNLVKTVQVGEIEETTIKIILPRPHDRVICDLDEIIIQFSGYAGRVRYGRAWEDIGRSPAIDPNEFGRKYPYGLTDWGSGSIDQDYEITLKFDACFLDADGPFLGYIWVEFSNIREEIEVSRCPSQDYCCLVDIPCQDCCAVIINAAAVIGLDTWIVDDAVDPIIGHFTTIIKVSPVGNEPICTQAIELEIFFVPPFHSPGMTHKVTVDHDRTWVRGGFEPNPIAGDGLLTDIKTDWGTIEETELKIGFHNECWAVPGSPTCELLLLYPNILVSSTEFPGSAVRFEECNVDPEICCPQPGCFDVFSTGQVVLESREDDEGESCPVDQHWFVNGDNAFIHPRFGGDMNYGCESANWVVVRCSTIAEPGGADGYEATFSTTFEIAEGACLSRMKLVGEYSADNYVVAGEWKVNGIDQSHIPHGSFNETTTIGCVEFEITNVQGGFQVGTNTIAIKVKNGFVGSGTFGGPFGLLLSYACVEVEFVP